MVDDLVDDLITQLEEAPEGSRELDAQIHAIVNGGYLEQTGHPDGSIAVWGEDRGIKKASVSGHEYRDRDFICDAKFSPRYTTSLDAKIPGENIVSISELYLKRHGGYSPRWFAMHRNGIMGVGHTEPLARRIAALKAREQADG